MKQIIRFAIIVSMISVFWLCTAGMQSPHKETICEKAPSVKTIEFYISPTGSDTYPGTKDKSFLTLAKARDTIRKLNNKSKCPVPITVNLLQGRYFLDETFELDQQDSGQTGSPVIYQACSGQQVIVSGGRIVSGWKKLTDDPPGTDPNAKGKLWYAEIDKDFFPHFLYVEGQKQILARYPNEGFFEGDTGIRHFGDPSPKGQLIKFPDHVKKYLPYLPSNGDVEMSWIPIIWANGVSVLRDFNLEENTARRHSKNVLYKGNTKYDWTRGNRFRLQNALCFIDMPGEFAVDTAKGRIYYWPQNEKAFKSAEVIVPKLYELVKIKGGTEEADVVHDIQFKGITFTHTDRMPEDIWPDEWLKRNFENPDAALFIENARNITIEGCKVIDVGAYGITLNHYAQNNNIIGNEIAWTGCGGIQLFGFGPGTKDVNKGNRIVRNLIHHVGKNDYMHSAAVSLYQSGANIISHNYIYDCPYAGIVMVGAFYMDLNDMRRANWTKESDSPYMHTDAYGSFEAQYKVRWQDFPEGTYEKWREGTGTLSEYQYFQYQHCRDNYVAWNILSNCLNGLADGGALYAWCCGLGNIWEHNLVRDSEDKTLYMDDSIYGTILRDNICWGIGGTISKGSNYWIDNRFDYPQRPAGYYSRFMNIYNHVQKQGGWPGPLDQNVPTLEIQYEDGKIFYESKVVSIRSFVQDSKIRYTLDGSKVNQNSPVYQHPIEITDSTVVKAAAFKKNQMLGDMDTITFTKIAKPIIPDVPVHQTLYLNKVPYGFTRQWNRWIAYEFDDFNVKGKKYVIGINLLGQDQIALQLRPDFKRFVAMIAPDDLSDSRSHVTMEILVDEKIIYESPQLVANMTPIHIDVPLPQNSKVMIIRMKNATGMYMLYCDLIHPGFMLTE